MNQAIIDCLCDLERATEAHGADAPFVVAGCRLALAGNPQAGMIPGADPVTGEARAAYAAGVEVGRKHLEALS